MAHQHQDAEKDPVCGMTVDPATAKHHATHDGQEHYFCSARCRERFVADPQTYLSPQPETPPAPVGAIYTCPMHPEVRQTGPGACPKCGMALEPELITADAPESPELADMSRRFWIGLALATPVFVLEMGGHLVDLHHLISPTLSGWVQFVLATPVVVWCGLPFFQRGLASVAHRSLNMFTLIAMGVGVAYAYSVLAILAPGLFPPDFRMMGGAVPVYFEAAAVIVVLVLLGQVLELRAREKTSGALKALLDLTPKMARRVTADGADEDIGLGEVRVGDQLRVRPGEQVPVDGVIVSGGGSLDESLVTGESMPVTRGAGEPVIGGALNRIGGFVMRAERVGADMLLSRIVQMVAQAQRSRAPVQRMADRVSAWFVPAVIAAALVAFVIWSLVGPSPRLTYALVAAVSVLIIACPCALGLATPMSIMVGVGRGAQSGILIRDAEALERFESIDTLVVDKTGTLTEGRPAVTEIALAPGFDRALLLHLAASVERASEHPLADAITRTAADEGVALSEPTHFQSPEGKGVVGEVDGRKIAIGAERFMAELAVDWTLLMPHAAAMRDKGATALFVAVDGRLAGVIAIADPIKATSAQAIRDLKAAKIRVVMMTGDNHTTAMAVAREVGIDDVRAEVLPQDKADVVRQLRAEGRSVAMVGDGVNDAPALAAAEVGVAMGTGVDVAIQSAGVTLLSGDLRDLVRARKLSRMVMRNIRQNLAFAFVYNLAGVPIAAGLFYPAFGVLLTPALAAAAMSLSSVSVITNALRLRAVRL